jgi:hypothetical protein
MTDTTVTDYAKKISFLDRFVRKSAPKQQMPDVPIRRQVKLATPQNLKDEVVAELARQDERTFDVQTRFFQLNKAMLAADPTLMKAQTNVEKTFVAAAAKIRIKTATVCMEAARVADKAEAAVMGDGPSDERKAATEAFSAFDKLRIEVRAEFDRAAKVADDFLDSALGGGGLDAALGEAKANEADAALATEYDRLRAETGRIVDELLEWGAANADQLAGFYAKRAPKSPPSYAEAMPQLKEMSEIAKLAQTKHKNDYYALRRPLEESYLELTRRNAELAKTSDYGALSKPQKQMIVDQLTMIETAMNSGQNPQALEAAKDLIAAGKKMLDEVPGAAEKLGLVDHRIARLDEELGHSTYRKIRPEHHAALLKEVSEFKKKHKEMDVSAAAKMASDLRQRVYMADSSLKQVAERQIAWRDTAKARMKAIKGLLDKLGTQFKAQTKAVSGATKFEGEILATYASIEDIIASEPESNMAIADGMMKAMEDKLNRWLASPNDATVKQEIAADHATGRQKGSAVESRRAELQRRFDAMEELLRSTRKEYSTKETKADFDEVGAQRKSAKDMLKKDETLDQAEQLIQRCETRIRSLMDSSKKLSRSKMGDIGKEWAGVVDKMNRDIEALLDIIATKAGTDEPNFNLAAQNRLAQTLGRATDLFDKTSFDRAATVFANKNASEADLRKAREEALKHVSRYIEIITNDPVLKKLMTNPFGVDVLSNAYQTLNDFEYKSLIAV